MVSDELVRVFGGVLTRMGVDEGGGQPRQVVQQLVLSAVGDLMGLDEDRPGSTTTSTSARREWPIHRSRSSPRSSTPG